VGEDREGRERHGELNMAARPAGLASRIADFACRLGWDDLSAPRRTKVRWFLADFIGSTLAGSTLPEAASGFVLGQPGPVKLPGDARGLTPESAAVAMGTVGALLQIHDGFGGGGNHPSSAIVSALWAARGERLRGREPAGAELASRTDARRYRANRHHGDGRRGGGGRAAARALGG
jgi:2-methylcitrate dehydratase PrpD